MTEVELVYFRGLAFKYLPKEDQERIKRNIEVVKRLGRSVSEAYPHILNPYRAENDTEMAACFLLNDVKMAAAARELKRGDEDLALFDEAVVESAMELAKVAEIALPVWVTKSQKLDAEALQQEVEALKAEVERLKAEKEKLGIGDDKRQVKNMAKVIYGVAVNKYQYNPALQRNEATGAIEKALERQGIQTTASTLKRYIDTGKAALEEDGK